MPEEKNGDAEIIAACLEIIHGVKQELQIMSDQSRGVPDTLGSADISRTDWLDALDRRRLKLAEQIDVGPMPGPSALPAMAEATIALFHLEVGFAQPRQLLPHQKVGLKVMRALVGEQG